LITATIEGDEYHTYATEAYGSSRYYYLTIRAPQGKEYSDGTKVTFEISGYSADQAAIYKAGSNTSLDLTASSDAVAAPVNTWLITFLTILLIGAAGLACYLLFRIVVRRRKLKRNFTAVEKETAIEEPRAIYVWDKDKLAWVQAAETATTGSPHRVQVKSNTGEQQSGASSLIAKKPAIKRNRAAKFPR
jgi:hypothetical protein